MRESLPLNENWSAITEAPGQSIIERREACVTCHIAIAMMPGQLVKQSCATRNCKNVHYRVLNTEHLSYRVLDHQADPVMGVEEIAVKFVSLRCSVSPTFCCAGFSDCTSLRR